MTFAAEHDLDRSPQGLSVLFSNIERALVSARTMQDTMTVLCRIAVAIVPAATSAGVTLARSKAKLRTIGATDDLVERTDAVQYELGSGPCVDAVLHDRVFRANDLRIDERWPVFGHRAAEMGVLSMQSIRMFLPEEAGALAGLNLYATQPDAFDDTSETVAMLLATHGALALSGALAKDRAANLETALDSNREIGVAMGILMNEYKLSREEAFNLVRITSQDTNRKLNAVASQVVETGKIDLPPRLR